ncbi:uncharacterized protein [Miscanthus floridulus]|uniref:uncharacterized protein n=1 Tax=Miscanthus floridulus TaxID=154761 RepID=UPI003457BD81
MDNKNVTSRGRGVKVTYIETQFVTSDAAGFKDLVQRLTGRSAPLPPAPHRPLPCRHDDGRRGWSRPAAAGAGPQGAYQYPVAAEVRPAVISSRTPKTYLEDMGLDDVIGMGDFSDLFYVGAASERSDGCCGGFPY